MMVYPLLTTGRKFQSVDDLPNWLERPVFMGFLSTRNDWLLSKQCSFTTFLGMRFNRFINDCWFPMSSASMAGNLIGKFGLGWLNDRHEMLNVRLCLGILLTMLGIAIIRQSGGRRSC
jgi:hypothetical protein